MRIIAGSARGTRIEAPEGRDTRPTLDRVRENLFNMIQTRVAGSRILDLFAGSGALGLEAVSRGAEYAVAVDSSRKAQQVIRGNIEKLRFEKVVRLIPRDWRDAVRLLKAEEAQFDLVFLDPPYAMRNLEEVFSELSGLIAEDAWVILEHEAGAQDIRTDPRFRKVKERAWGYCGMTIYEWGKEQ